MKNRWNIKWVKTFPVVADCEESNVSIIFGIKKTVSYALISIALGLNALIKEMFIICS